MKKRSPPSLAIWLPGIFARRPPNPIGNKMSGSNDFDIAKYISKHEIESITKVGNVRFARPDPNHNSCIKSITNFLL